jgi:hypothetical protein
MRSSNLSKTSERWSVGRTRTPNRGVIAPSESQEENQRLGVAL